jgi:hypothetical protein
MTIYVIICLVLLVYWKVKNQYILRVTIKYQYKLYDLRDKLRDLAVANKIDKSSWRFKYLDGSISKTISELVSINLITTAILNTKYRKDKDFLFHEAIIMKGMGEDGYSHFIYEEYGNLIIDYVYEKHFIVRRVLKWLFFCLFISDILAKGCTEWFKKEIGNFRILPETSQGYEVTDSGGMHNYNFIN